VNQSRLTDVQAEDAIVGILVMQWHRLNTDDVSAFMALKPEQFWSPEARASWVAIQFLWTAGREIDLLNIVYAERELKLQPLAAYVTRLAADDTFVHRGEYATLIERVRDSSNRRTLSNSARAALAALEGGASTAEVSEAILAGVAGAYGEVNGPTPIKLALDDALKAAQAKAERRASGERSLYPSSLPELSEVFSYEPGTMTVIAGRPGMGKSSFALQEGVSFSQAGRAGVFVSIEMDAGQCALRCTGITAGVNVSEVMAGQINDIHRLQRGIQAVCALPIMIDDESFARIEDVVRKCRILHAQGKCDYVILDHIGIVKPSGNAGKNGTREQEVSHISGTFRGMARALKIPVLCLAQLNRESDKREKKEPVLSDLRESGAIEQDADVVLFPYRYGRHDETAGDRAAIIVRKNRNGAEAKVECKWSGNRMCFVSAHSAGEPEPPVH
jgi:replicative DNA helicase